MIEKLASRGSVVVAAHRGLKCDFPENTILAFRKALEEGVDMLELDLRLSKDGVLMIIHDETVDRTTNGTGLVREHTFAELKRLDAGAWFDPGFTGLEIPAFEELCQLLASYPEALLNVEIKPDRTAKEAADKAVAMLEEFGFLSRCVFTSFDAAIIDYLHDAYQLKTQGFPAELMSNFDSGIKGTFSKMWAVGISMKLLTSPLVERFREMGILTWCYCPDDDQQVYEALAHGITLMTCNDPRPAMRIRLQAEAEAQAQALE